MFTPVDGHPKSPLSVPPPRKTRFGSPLVLSRVHWVEPKLVAEITYLTWTADGLLGHTAFVGLREDKPATDVLAKPRLGSSGSNASPQCSGRAYLLTSVR